MVNSAREKKKDEALEGLFTPLGLGTGQLSLHP
jgi:hypothetical protein